MRLSPKSNTVHGAGEVRVARIMGSIIRAAMSPLGLPSHRPERLLPGDPCRSAVQCGGANAQVDRRDRRGSAGRVVLRINLSAPLRARWISLRPPVVIE